MLSGRGSRFVIMKVTVWVASAKSSQRPINIPAIWIAAARTDADNARAAIQVACQGRWDAAKRSASGALRGWMAQDGAAREPTKRLALRVVSVTPEAKDIVAVELAHPDGEQLPAFTAGAHIDVHLADGLTRQYSLCNAPGERHRYLVAVLNEPSGRGGSQAMHRLKPGDIVTVSGPRNNFALAGREASFHLLLAGGIG